VLSIPLLSLFCLRPCLNRKSTSSYIYNSLQPVTTSYAPRLTHVIFSFPQQTLDPRPSVPSTDSAAQNDPSSAQYFLLPLLLGRMILPCMLSNTLYALATVWYAYITHLGYRGEGSDLSYLRCYLSRPLGSSLFLSLSLSLFLSLSLSLSLSFSLSLSLSSSLSFFSFRLSFLLFHLQHTQLTTNSCLFPALPFLTNTQVFLWYPIILVAVLWILSVVLLVLGIHFNLTRIIMTFHYS
jgi:UNC-50 family